MVEWVEWSEVGVWVEWSEVGGWSGVRWERRERALEDVDAEDEANGCLL